MTEKYFTWKMYIDLSDKQTKRDGSYAALDSFIERIRSLHNSIIHFVNTKIHTLENDGTFTTLRSLLNYSEDKYEKIPCFTRIILNNQYKKLLADYGFGYNLSGVYTNSEGFPPSSIVKQFTEYSRTHNINTHSCSSFLEVIENNRLSNSLQKYFYQRGTKINYQDTYNYGVNTKGFNSTSEQVRLVTDNELTSIKIWKVNGEIFKLKGSKLRNGIPTDELEHLIKKSLLENTIIAKSCQIKKGYYGTKVRYSVNFLFSGEKPLTTKQKRKLQYSDKGNAGIDLGPKTVAVHFTNDTEDLLELNSKLAYTYDFLIKKMNRKISILIKEMESCPTEGQYKKYNNLYNQLRSIYRKRKTTTNNYQNHLAHFIHQHADSIIIEQKNIKEMRSIEAFKNKGVNVKYKCYERTIQFYNPGALFNKLQNLSVYYNHDFITVPSSYAASQYDIYGNKKKKQLKDRMIFLVYNDLVYTVQRDLFSAYLLSYPDHGIPDFKALRLNFLKYIDKQNTCLLKKEKEWLLLSELKNKNSLNKITKNEKKCFNPYMRNYLQVMD